MNKKYLFHVTTDRKLERYKTSKRIILPVRGFTTLTAAQQWANKTGRNLILKIFGEDCHKLPDHRQPSGEAWWIDHDVLEWEIIK